MEKYNCTVETQDAILIGIIRRPDLFLSYQGTLNTAYFTGVHRIAAARALFDYHREHHSSPSDFGILAQVVYDAIAHTSEQKEEEEILKYIVRLRDMEITDGELEYVADHVLDFAKQRAAVMVTCEMAKSLEEGKKPIHQILSESFEMLQEASRVGTTKGQLSSSIRHITVSDIISDDGKPPEALIEGILPIGGLAVIAGRAKGFKSWTAMALALATAAGGDWLDFKVKQRPAIYVNFELMDKTLKSRFKVIADAMHIDMKSIEDKLFPLTFDAAQTQITGKDGTHENKFTQAICGEIRMALRTLKVKGGLIILDSFYNLSGGANENDASQVKQIYRYIRKLLADTECTGLLVHHFAKGDVSQKAEGERGAGSRVHRQEPDCYAELVPHKEDNAVVLTLDLRNYKSVEKQCYKWDHPLLVPAPSLDPNEIKKPGGAPETYSDHEMLLPLIDGPMSQSAWKKAVQESTGMSPSTFKDRKRRLLRERKITLVGPKGDQEIGIGTSGRELLSASGGSNGN